MLCDTTCAGERPPISASRLLVSLYRQQPCPAQSIWQTVAWQRHASYASNSWQPVGYICWHCAIDIPMLSQLLQLVQLGSLLQVLYWVAHAPVPVLA
jgi:hypothetical protein